MPGMWKANSPCGAKPWRTNLPEAAVMRCIVIRAAPLIEEGLHIYLLGVADGQLAGHDLQLGQSSVQLLLSLSGQLSGAAVGFRQRAEQPQDGQNFLPHLGQKKCTGEAAP